MKNISWFLIFIDAAPALGDTFLSAPFFFLWFVVDFKYFPITINKQPSALIGIKKVI